MVLQAIDYTCDGVTMTGYLADGAHGPGPAAGILLAHAAPGMTQQMRDHASALAKLGYVAFALDMYGAHGFSHEEAQRRHADLLSMPALMRRRATAALDVLANQPTVDPARLAAVGFCQGGITIMELARAGLPLRSAIGFHPGLKRPVGSTTGTITAKILMLVGDADPVVPPQDREAFIAEMQAASIDWQMHLFGGVGHAFTDTSVDAMNIPGFHYDASASRRGWKMMLDLLEETLTDDAE